MSCTNVRYIDLFAGLGGFHLALSELGHECVFASEIDSTLRELYEKNFKMKCSGDIRNVSPAEIPPHDILCAGFPCQPFSKAGPQEGLDHPSLGDLYLYILGIVRLHKPKYLILENVPNLQKHGNGKSWSTIKEKLEEVGYNVDVEHISPHQFGIPQIRNRIYIIASTEPLTGVKNKLKLGRKLKERSLREALFNRPLEPRYISTDVRTRLDAWQEFLDLIPTNEAIPLPLWGMEFGATYPYEDSTPFSESYAELKHYKGPFGRDLSNLSSKDEILKALPSYAQREQDKFPDWKIRYIKRSREFFSKHQLKLAEWSRKMADFPPSFQKLEWNCHEKRPEDEDRRLKNYVVQLRPSGVRVKRPSTSPSIVAMNMTQVPIIMWENRYVSPEECKILQSMEKLKYLPETPSKSYCALGNAVNVTVARRVALALVGRAKKENNLSNMTELEVGDEDIADRVIQEV